MKLVVACALLALCAVSIDSKPWGKYVQISVNKNYNGPNFVDVLSGLVRQKMEFKNNIWNAFLNAKPKRYDYNYSYNHQPYSKTVSINYGPTKTNGHDSDSKKEVEVHTPPPIPKKVAPLVEHEKTFEFNAQSSFSSSSAGSSAGTAVRSTAGNDSDSELVDIAEHQRNNN